MLFPSQQDPSLQNGPEAEQEFGPYRLVAQLASGQLSTVHLATVKSQASASSLIAIKRLQPAVAGDAEMRSALVNEGRIGQRLRSPHTVRVLDVQAQPEPFLVLEYIEGLSLSAILERTRGADLTRYVLPIIVETLQGLEALHKQRSRHGEPASVVHQAPCARHILIGTEGVTRIIDLSHAAERGRPWSPRRDERLRAEEMAPEQALAPGHIDARCDVFIAGVTLWEALTGQRLFAAASSEQALQRVLRGQFVAPSQVAAHCPAGLDRICERALQHAPWKRFGSAAEMADALTDFGLRHKLYADQDEIRSWLRTLMGQAAATAEAATQLAPARPAAARAVWEVPAKAVAGEPAPTDVAGVPAASSPLSPPSSPLSPPSSAVGGAAAPVVLGGAAPSAGATPRRPMPPISASLPPLSGGVPGPSGAFGFSGAKSLASGATGARKRGLGGTAVPGIAARGRSRLLDTLGRSAEWLAQSRRSKSFSRASIAPSSTAELLLPEITNVELPPGVVRPLGRWALLLAVFGALAVFATVTRERWAGAFAAREVPGAQALPAVVDATPRAAREARSPTQAVEPTVTPLRAPQPAASAERAIEAPAEPAPEASAQQAQGAAPPGAPGELAGTAAPREGNPAPAALALPGAADQGGAEPAPAASPGQAPEQVGAAAPAALAGSAQSAEATMAASAAAAAAAPEQAGRASARRSGSTATPAIAPGSAAPVEGQAAPPSGDAQAAASAPAQSASSSSAKRAGSSSLRPAGHRILRETPQPTPAASAPPISAPPISAPPISAPPPPPPPPLRPGQPRNVPENPY